MSEKILLDESKITEMLLDSLIENHPMSKQGYSPVYLDINFNKKEQEVSATVEWIKDEPKKTEEAQLSYEQLAYDPVDEILVGGSDSEYLDVEIKGEVE